MAGIASVAWSQELPDSARLFTIDVSTGLEWSDNPDLLVDGESRLINRTSLDFGLERRTGVDRFFVGFGGDIIIGDDTSDTEGPEFESPDLRLSWDRDVGHSRIGIEASYIETPLDSTDVLISDAPDSDDFTTVDGGVRRNALFELDGAFGVDAFLGGTYRFRQEQIRYEDTGDPDLLDSDFSEFEGALTAQVDPGLQLGLSAAQSYLDETGPDAIDTLTTRLGTIVNADITPTLSGRANLGWERVDETGETDTTDEGIFFEGGLSWLRPNGTFAVDLDSTIEINGRRDTLQARRAMETRWGDLSYAFGFSRAEDFDVRPIFGFGWNQELPRARLAIDLTQTPTTSSDNTETVISALTATYNQELTSLSAFDMTLSVLDSDELSDDDADTRRYGLELAYRHNLAQDWDMVGRFSTVLIEEEDEEDRSANTIFIGLEKRFGWN